MSVSVLIIGQSGTGKSSAIRTLPPAETFVLNVIGKTLPFKGASKQYVPISSDGTTGNYYASDDHAAIMRVIALVNKKRPDIKYFVIDDMSYTMTNDFMRTALIKGYEKFSILAKDAWEVIRAINDMRSDLTCFMMMHSDTDQHGNSKPKTIGKLLDEKVCIEGMFTICLHAVVIDGQYGFITNHDGVHMAKSPAGMFSRKIIPNDLAEVVTHINEYLNEDIKQ